MCVNKLTKNKNHNIMKVFFMFPVTVSSIAYSMVFPQSMRSIIKATKKDLFVGGVGILKWQTICIESVVLGCPSKVFLCNWE